MTFIGVSAAVYLIAAVLLRKVSKNTISCGICIFLPVIVYGDDNIVKDTVNERCR